MLHADAEPAIAISSQELCSTSVRHFNSTSTAAVSVADEALACQSMIAPVAVRAIRVTRVVELVEYSCAVTSTASPALPPVP